MVLSCNQEVKFCKASSALLTEIGLTGCCCGGWVVAVGVVGVVGVVGAGVAGGGLVAFGAF